MKLLIFILFSSLVYADEKPIIPILYKVSHPDKRNTLWLWATFHTEVKLSNFPNYIQRLILAADQVFLEYAVVEEIYTKLNYTKTISKDLFHKEIIESNLSNYLGNASKCPYGLPLDLEINLLAFLVNTKSYSLDSECLALERIDDVLLGIRLGVHTKSSNREDLESYQNGDIALIQESTKNTPFEIYEKRELVWVDKILAQIEEKQLINLIAIGVGHLNYGQNRLLSLFEDHGWTVEKFNPNNTVDVTALEDFLKLALLEITSHSTLTE